MRKSFTKIICFAAAFVVALGIMLTAACSNKYKVKPLDGDISVSSAEISNGGLAVEKGNYVYFINGRESYTADNTFGNVVKGAIMRISKTDLAARNYSSVQTVVPSIVYAGNSNAGIYIYGDRVYYTTPSTEKTGNGDVQNSYLQFRSTRLDGTDTVKDYYLQFADNSTEYRYVEENGTVYILYVATNEDLYGTSCTNLHSYNTKTGADTLLAYNVSAVTFDKKDLTNPRVFYTMNVTDYVTNTSFSSYYNQIYTVSASATERNDYKLGDIVEDYDAKKDPLYVNCGKLVFDGIGKVQNLTNSITPFNGEGADKVDRSALKYTISSYEDGYLYYTRTTAQNSTAVLFNVKAEDVLKADWKPVANNPSDDDCLIRDGGSASSYIYLYDNGELTGALVAGSTGLEKLNLVDGKIPSTYSPENRFYLTTDGQATLLFTAVHGEKNYIYYSLSGGNGYTVYRICYDGEYKDYNELRVTDAVDEYTAVRVLDLDSSSSWYKPEMFDNQILFCSQTAGMTEYEYVMVCDLRDAESGEMMTNAQIKDLGEQYESIEKAIADIDDSNFENLPQALRYAFYTSESDYIGELIQAYVDIEGKKEEYLWSKESIEKYNAFIKAETEEAVKEWVDLKYGATVKVNGKDVAANKRDYYYAVLGQMNDADIESYFNAMHESYFPAYPEEVNDSWFANLKKGAKIGFVLGVVAGGLIVIGAAVVGTLIIIRKKKEKLPAYTKKRIKVDTTDDKDVDVYSD